MTALARQSWRVRAACVGTDPNLFEVISTGEGGPGGPESVPRVRKALAICAACPVIRECDLDARSSWDRPITGVRGGHYVNQTEARTRLADAVTAHRLALCARYGPRIVKIRESKGYGWDTIGKLFGLGAATTQEFYRTTKAGTHGCT